MPPRARCAVLIVFGASLLSLTRPVRALGPDGSSIDTSDYTIDFYQGPILASSRTTGLAGSFAPLAPGVIGYPVNPAAVAMRVPWSTEWFDWELDGSITSPTSISNTDFDNNGDETFANEKAVFVTLGGGLQYGEIGLGLRVDTSQHQVSEQTGGDAELAVELSRIDLVLGNMFLGGQLAAGVGLGVHAIELVTSDSQGNTPPLLAVQGGSVALGATWLPASLPLRGGLSVRFPVPDEDSAEPTGVTPDVDDNYVSEGYFFPRRIVVPTEIHAALATQLFAPLNAPWRIPRYRYSKPPPQDTAMRRYARASRGRLLLSTALQVTLPTRNGIGVESFLTQQVERSGRTTTFSPRFGAESEVWPHYLVLRGGSYLEPTRFAASEARWHGTFGFDVHVPLVWTIFGLLPDGSTFRIGGAVDGASRYFGWSASLGVWH